MYVGSALSYLCGINGVIDDYAECFDTKKCLKGLGFDEFA